MLALHSSRPRKTKIMSMMMMMIRRNDIPGDHFNECHLWFTTMGTERGLFSSTYFGPQFAIKRRVQWTWPTMPLTNQRSTKGDNSRQSPPDCPPYTSMGDDFGSSFSADELAAPVIEIKYEIVVGIFVGDPFVVWQGLVTKKSKTIRPSRSSD